MGQNTGEEIHLRRLLEVTESLPTLPFIALEGMKRALKPSGSIAELAQVIELDPALTARVLQVANTFYYNPDGRITSLHKALSSLRLPVLRSIVLSASVLELFSDRREDYGLDLGELWMHSIGAAVWARELAPLLPSPVDPEEAFISGLLHDIGKVILCNHLKGGYRPVLALAKEKGIRLFEAEKECLGYDHGEVSRWVLEHWKIPPLYCNVVSYHHYPVKAFLADPYHVLVCRLVHLADHLCYCYKTGAGGDPSPQSVSGSLLAELSLVRSSVEGVHSQIHRHVKELADRLEWGPIPLASYFPALRDANRTLWDFQKSQEIRHRESVQREKELAGINALGLVLQAAGSLEQAARGIAETLLGVFSFDQVICTLFLSGRWELTAQARRGGSEPCACDVRLEEKLPEKEPDLERRRPGVSYLFVDLIGKEGPLGFLKVQARPQGTMGLEKIGLLLASCAKIAAEAIENIRFHQRNQQLTETLKRSIARIDQQREAGERERIEKDRIVASLPVGLVMLDERGRIRSWNPAAEGIFPAGRLSAGTSFTEIFTDPRFWKGRLEVLKGISSIFQGETTLMADPEGRSQRVCRWNLLKVLDQPEEGSLLACILSDVTEERGLQKQLLEAARMASVGELAAGTAHNLRSPLGAVKGILELLLEELDSGRIVPYATTQEPARPAEAVREQIQLVLKSLNKCFSVIDDLIQLARSPDQAFEEIRLHTILDGTESLLGDLLRARGIRIEKDLDADVVYGRQADLLQVFLNLYSNAYKAMPDGGLLKVRSRPDPRRPAQPGRFIEVVVSDSGCGIPQENIPKIFDPFFTTSDRVEGTGLGLSLTLKIVREHGGSLEVAESKVGEGTTFRLSLPAHPDALWGRPGKAGETDVGETQDSDRRG
ncbi:MAG: HDOD domain-containing protein [bacterium]